jgi:flagellar secretion chaperone FliS
LKVRIKTLTPYNRNVQDYKEVKYGSASPEKLLLMVFDGAVKFLKTAKFYREKNMESKAQVQIFKACDCVAELLATLNYEASPDIANALQRIYLHVMEGLRQSIMHGTNKEIDESMEILGSLKQSWEEAFSKQESQLQKTGT